MSYTYDPLEFSDSNSLNMCFENFEYELEEKYYIHASGTFYCAYSDQVKINIKTRNKVLYFNNKLRLLYHNYAKFSSNNKKNTPILGVFLCFFVYFL